MKKLLLITLGVLFSLPGFARDFKYEYKGQTLTYTVIDEEAKTCSTKEGQNYFTPGNKISGELELPANPKDGEVEYTLTEIATNAFINCTGLTSVTIPNSVTYIGQSAFEYCTGLTSLSLPGSLTEIGSNAFYWCTGLTSVIIPPSVTSIGPKAFYQCEELIKSAYPSSFDNPFVDKWNAWGAQYGVAVSYDPEGAIIENGWIYGPDKKSILFAPYDIEGDYTIPTSVISIGDNAFSQCNALTSITIPNSVTSIGERAFDDCTGLTSITIPNSVTSIGGRAFCYCTGLTSITIPNSVSEMGNGAFAVCDNLKELIIADCKEALSLEGHFGGNIETLYLGRNISSSESPFQYCENLKEVTISEFVTYIPSSAFFKCTALTSITIPSSVTSIYSSAFNDCNNLKELILADGSESLSFFGDIYDNAHYLETLYLGRNISSYPSPFRYNARLKEVTISKFVTELGFEAFSSCYGLKEIVIPRSVTSIGEMAFYDCTGLTSITIPNSVTSIGERAFCYCTGLTSITIPNYVTSLGSYAFYNCSALESVCILPYELKDLPEGVFSGCTSLTKIVDNRTIFPQSVFCDYGFNDYNFSFYNVPRKAVIYIRKGNHENFASVPGWDYFSDFREIEEDYVNITPKAPLISVGQSQQLSTYLHKDDDDDISIVSEKWSIEDPAIATVDENGVVTGISEGETYVYIDAIDSLGVPLFNATRVIVIGDTGIDEVMIDSTDSIEIYNLNGLRVNADVNSLTPGIYIMRQGAKTKKILVK